MALELALESVGYRYRGGHEAVAGVGLTMAPGIVGLLGPNGAGKSTLMRVLSTLAKPTSGRVLWRGEDIVRRPDALRGELGYLPQDFGVYEALSAREFLVFLAAVKGLPSPGVAARVDECLEMVGLDDVADRRLGGYSGGMRQRVGIAQALLNDPKLLIVDEPTVGLDPEERVRFRHLLAELAGERLVILSTHIVSDIEASASTLAVMSGGRLRFHGTPEALMAEADGHVWQWTVAAEQLAEARTRLRISRAQRRAHGVEVRVVGEEPPASDAVPVAPDLEDAYLWLLHRNGTPP
ncbi:ABC transporter ATP-binding protein [Thermomonas carbonis]|uniref:ABC transporter ATP-binding protein n=1 Tax=Thermomonas carbonis TaxID=1463158 RepID=A0A7G9SPI9_9GAMM|nr:ABC transporter ATP-binding protein [Thermomonas carbonis]QNN69764.1 ABC transporter ATP-binding protein [Thermomonas carbonis]GHB95348.1 ABC transporter ATP-binding protein [Thermomonas carbonis]